MPGVLYNPLNNPLQSYLSDTPGGTEKMYNDSVAKGYKYVGGVNPWEWDGTQSTNPGGANYVPPDNIKAPWAGPLLPGGGGGGGGGTTSLATGGSVAGPYKADAQLSQARNEFDRILNKGLGQLAENQNIRGAFGGGVGTHEANEYTRDVSLGSQAAIERIMNDVLGRNQAWDLQQKAFELDKQRAAWGGAGKYSSKDGGDDLMALYQMMTGGGGSAPGFETGPAGQNVYGYGKLSDVLGYGPDAGMFGGIPGFETPGGYPLDGGTIYDPPLGGPIGGVDPYGGIQIPDIMKTIGGWF